MYRERERERDTIILSCFTEEPPTFESALVAMSICIRCVMCVIVGMLLFNMCVCLCIYIYIYTHIHIYIYIERERARETYTHIHTYMPIHIHIYIYIYICICIGMYVVDICLSPCTLPCVSNAQRGNGIGGKGS